MPCRFITLLTLAIAIGVNAIAFSQCALPESKLAASDAASLDRFGSVVSISGSLAIVGHPLDDSAGQDSGAAYVYRFNGSDWIEEQKIVASDGESSDRFGAALSISGNVLLIGAYEDDEFGPATGSAYVYRYNGSSWIEEQKLLASDAAGFKSFGISVSLDGDLAFIGSPNHDTDRGAVYVFRFNGASWIEEQMLFASDSSIGQKFGISLASSGSTAIVSTENSSTNSSTAAVYFFRYDGMSWNEEQNLVPSPDVMGNTQHFSLAMNGNAAVVGAHQDDSGGPSHLNSGAAYVYRYNGMSWTEEQRLTASDAGPADLFGIDVAINGDKLIVGATEASPVGKQAAYVFSFDGSQWAEERIIAASDASDGDLFGAAVSISGDSCMVGANGTDFDGLNNAGSAYIYDLSTPAEMLFTRGDVNADQSIDIADTILLLSHLFSDGELSCQKAGDINDDGLLNIADPIYELAFLFSFGQAIPLPVCGLDPSQDMLSCCASSCP